MCKKVLVFSLLFLCYMYVSCQNTSLNGTKEAADDLDLEAYRQRLDNQTKRFENRLKTAIKSAVKSLLPTLMSHNGDSQLSTKCMRAFMKYISGLTSVKLWAMKMLDAMSKPPAGILTGTFSDFGAFDQCLDIELPNRKGGVEFRGQYCAIEIKPLLPKVPKNFSLAKQAHAEPLDSIAREFVIGGMSFYYLKFRLGICVPSLCSVEEMQALAKQIGTQVEMDVKIPQCYVQESLVFKPVHIAVIFVVSLLLISCIAGSVIEYKTMDVEPSERKLSRGQQILVCFSLISNYRRLISASKGSDELKALHGLRAFSMAWVILGHTYVWTNFQLLRRPEQLVVWFNSIDFGSILNGWLSVEPFFFLSGLLTCYAVMKIMPKTKGRINVPVYILRRYVRLTPPLLLVMGLAFFMPLLSQGPFWYERVDPEIRSCTKYWWRSILYISNWTGMKNICVHPTWYLSADFQLHVISVVFLYVLYRSPKLGLSLIAAFLVACTALVATLTTLWELPPIILISSGNNDQIEQTVDVVHMNTFTHAGPYFVGIIVGYLIIKYKDVKMSKVILASGWFLSTVVSLTSLYGAHRWNIGEPHGPILTAIYASMHRTTFTIGVAWVAFVCVTGHGGLVNRFLSSSMLAPISRLTFMIYLMHPLVIWVRMGSLRERTFYSHYNMLYDYIGNIVFTVLITVPVYLLIEAPLSNLERMVFSRAAASKKDTTDYQLNGNVRVTMAHSTKAVVNVKPELTTVIPVELMSVKNIENGFHNLAFRGDSLKKTENSANIH